MKTKMLIGFSALVILCAVSLPWLRADRGLPRFRLSDGAEFRVIQITYTPGASDSYEHNLGSAPKPLFWLWKRLPRLLQDGVPYPGQGIGNQGSYRPVLSIWWARIDPRTHQPELGPAGDVLMTLGSGKQINLGWPDPNDPGYRQIFVTDPPQNSKRLAFEVPVEGERVHFTIDNPAYRR